jgi:FixJ family two-component response regulator
MTDVANTVFAVDDDPPVLKALERLLRGARFCARDKCPRG